MRVPNTRDSVNNHRSSELDTWLPAGENFFRGSLRLITGKGGEIQTTLKKQLTGLLMALILIPVLAYAEEKNGTVQGYDAGSRMVTVKGKDWEQKAKVSSADAKDKLDLLKAGAKVKVEFDDRGGGDVRVKSINGR